MIHLLAVVTHQRAIRVAYLSADGTWIGHECIRVYLICNGEEHSMVQMELVYHGMLKIL